MGLFSKLKQTDNSTLPSLTTCKDGHCWWASFEFYPMAVGDVKTAFDARMYIPDDYFSKTESVVKAYNGGPGKAERIHHEVKISEIADDYAAKFHKIPGVTGNMRRINFVRPCLAVLDSVSIFNALFRYLKQYNKRLEEGEYVLLEPNIGKDFTNLIYSSGIINSCCPEYLQAFCHFSYFESNGQFVISNLQGTFSEGKINLSSPRIHSRNHMFGERDSGEQGISDFFAHHECNSICRNWPKPTDSPLVCPSAPTPNSSNIEKFTNDNGSSGQNVGAAHFCEGSFVEPIAPPPYELTCPNLNMSREENKKMNALSDLPAVPVFGKS